jgi:hypothetical protein
VKKLILKHKMLGEGQHLWPNILSLQTASRPDWPNMTFSASQLTYYGIIQTFSADRLS